jgi:hypothetical protein
MRHVGRFNFPPDFPLDHLRLLGTTSS